MDEPTLACPACRVIDRADGVEDGKLFKSGPYAVGNERRVIAAFRRTQDRVADRVTTFAGSLSFVYIHAVWFGVWIAMNAGLLGAKLVFDAFPYGLLTMVVSLEAIFLATFVMVSQNRQAARSEVRSDIDFENNLRAEIWSVHIGHALGIDTEHVEEVVRAAIAGYRHESWLTAVDHHHEHTPTG
ncbi:MAG TPA: DUF1003 domain-containing protein [Acidimicrobiia bacterium]|jgi:uncharacterized membrane protein